ncbi:MAG: hypothetical protein ACLPH3_10600 [Terracidiphilus sp.]
MSVASSLRKGLKFFLMSLGVSSPEKSGLSKQPRPAHEPANGPAPKIDPGK